MDDYLWDGTGPPDLEVVRLERALGRYRFGRSGRQRRWGWGVAATAACLLLAVGAWQMRPSSAWEINGKKVATGRIVRTGKNPVRLEAASLGHLELGPETQLEVGERLALRRGTMKAFIWAPPAKFRVDTPSARAIDLGCAYTLTVLPDESGLVTVQMGWVAFQSAAHESFIPAGAACRTRKDTGPGLPYFEGASRELRAGVERFEATGGRGGLAEIVSSAGSSDGLTLWHLLDRTQGGDRDRVIQRLAELVPGVDSSGLRAGKAGAVDQAWEALGLGGADWWRMWKQEWRTQR